MTRVCRKTCVELEERAGSTVPAVLAHSVYHPAVGGQAGRGQNLGLQLAWNDFMFSAVLTNNATHRCGDEAAFNAGDSGMDGAGSLHRGCW